MPRSKEAVGLVLVLFVTVFVLVIKETIYFQEVTRSISYAEHKHFLTAIEDDGLSPCRVVVENKADYHHEIIESAIHSYPLTTPHLDSKNCSKTKPVIYDFALLNARFGKHSYSTLAAISHKSINDTEFWSWKGYLDRKLKGRTFERDDGRLFEYGEFIQYDDYGRADMIIDITCELTPPRQLRRWIENYDDRFCIQHGECKECNDIMLNRTCFLSPVMWPESQCTFFPTKLPRFTKEELSLARTQYAGKDEPNDSVRVCVIGSGRNHSESAALVAALPYEKYHTYFHISYRSERDLIDKRGFYQQVISSKGTTSATFTMETDYEGFAKWVASCDINLLGIDPKSTPSKFPPSVVGEDKSQKKLTGLLPMVVAYETPTVVHEEFEKLYHGYFRGPVGVYNDVFENYVEVLGEMARELYKNKTIQ